MMTVLGLAFLIALISGGPAAFAQGETGPVCIGTYLPDPNCTANDMPVNEGYVLDYINADVCTEEPGDTAQVVLIFKLAAGSAQRSDHSIFVALDGGSATRLATEIPEPDCYHDYLAPRDVSSDPPPPAGNCPCKAGVAPSPANCNGTAFNCVYNPGMYDPDTKQGGGGGEPWFETDFQGSGDGDKCGDVEKDQTFWYETETLILECQDADPVDGRLDPIEVCVGWDHQQDDDCGGIADAFPSEKSKCDCSEVDLVALVYEGIDFGDLPDTYSTIVASDGASHVVNRDTDGDSSPDADVLGNQAVWLGAAVLTEEDAEEPLPGYYDDDSTGLEEDGVVPTGNWSQSPGEVEVTVSTSSGSGYACLNAWLDFAGDGNDALPLPDGDFLDPNNIQDGYDNSLANGSGVSEWIIQNRKVPEGTTQQTFPIPGNVSFIDRSFYARFRLTPLDADDGCGEAEAYQGNGASPQGLALNGEVEDYLFSFGPTAVTLSSFGATPSAGGRVAIALAALAVLVAALLAGFALVRRRGWIGG